MQIPTLCVALMLAATVSAAPLDQPPNTWVKRSPLPGGPPSPRMGYEASLAYDPLAKVLIRWGGHNQGGGGEQNAETWTFDPRTAVWTLKEPNDAPPGVCCAQQNVFDPVHNRFLRFPAFSGSHGWQWFREIYLKNSSVWSYDLATNTWRDRRPVPEPHLGPLRCADWDSDNDVVVVFGGEGSQEGTVVYDPYTNTWSNRHAPDQPAFRSGGNLAYDADHRLHILFGAQFFNDPHTWAYDFRSNRWRDLKPSRQPPTDRNDAVLAYDSKHGGVVAVVKITEGKDDNARHRLETWLFDAGRNVWTKANPPREPDASGNRARLLCYDPDLDLTFLETRTHPPQGPAEQQIWTYRSPVRAGDGEVRPKREPRARTQPPIVEDAVVSVLSVKDVELTWKPSAATDVVGYHVERAQVEVWSDDELVPLKKRIAPLAGGSVGLVHRIGIFTRLTSKPVNEPRFEDRVDLAQPRPVAGKPLWERRVAAAYLDPKGKPYRWAVYAYRVRAVNARRVESGPSPYFLTIPSAPQWFFSREHGTSCGLKWAKNPEKRLRGYRVYRLDGRWEAQPITRLTAEPIDALRFTDDTAGKATRRYHVVAVDALGQEGIPSAPVWFEREWKAFYKPFAGEWHQ
jgi:hypothetical protein